MGDLAQEAKAWDAWILSVRAGVTDRDEHTEERAAAVARELARLPPERRRTILDVGCGDGLDSVTFSKFGKVTATDLSPAGIADAQQRYRGSGVRFMAGDFLSMDVPGAPFDVITTLETISHVYDQPAFLRRCAELLAPGGALVLTTQNRAVYDFLGHGPPKGYLRRWLTRAELLTLAEPFFLVRSLTTISPPPAGTVVKALDGRRPPLWMRVVNSHKANALARAVVPRRALDRAKERAGLARTIVLVAEKR